MGFDPGINMLGAAAANANATMLQNNINSTAVSGSNAMGNASGMFDGSIANLQKQYPQVYQLLVLDALAYQICADSKRQNDNFIARLKEEQSRG